MSEKDSKFRNFKISSPGSLGNQGNSPDGTKDTIDLITQLAHSSNLQQHSDTESSELFTVGRLSLNNIEQSRSIIGLLPEVRNDYFSFKPFFSLSVPNSK